jgi:hypothetical protein
VQEFRVEMTTVLALEATRSTEHRRLIESFTLRSAHGEAVLQLIRRVDGKRIDSSGQGTLKARDVDKGRAFLADLGHPCSRPAGELKPFAFPVVIIDSGVDGDGAPWRELKLELAHQGRSADASLIIRRDTAELTVPPAADLFWDVARIALGEGVTARAPRPPHVTVSVPELLRGAEQLRLIELQASRGLDGGGGLLGLDAKGSVFAWGALDKKPHRVANLECTLTAVHAAGGRLAACGAAHATGAWQIVSVELGSGKMHVVAESSDAFFFLNASVLLSPDGHRLAAAFENELRVWGPGPLISVSHACPLTPLAWADGALIVSTEEGPLRLSDSGLARAGEPLVHRSGELELQAGHGCLRVGGRTWAPQSDDDLRCLQALEHTPPRWLDPRTLLLQSDRLVALDLTTLQTWAVFHPPDTQLFAQVGAQLVIDQQASGRPKFVTVT